MRRFLFIALVGCGRLIETVPDASSIGDASADAQNSALLAACDQYYDARFNRCGGPRLPPDEDARVKARFEQACENEVALPGSGVTQATLAACTSALDVSACELPFGPPVACDFRGTVPGGGPCTDGTQCASGSCAGQQGFTPEGPATAMKCGTCDPLVGNGEVCGFGNFTAGCDPNALCLSDPSADAGPTYRCTPIARGEVGASCDGLTSRCALGLYCAAQTGKCTELGSSGAPCGEGALPAYPGGCVAPLACVGPQGSATCSIGSTGTPCMSAMDCSAGLACVGSSSSPYATCQPVTWASPQQPCDGFSVLCLVGTCPDFGQQTCPAVIPDGRPCSPNDTCDSFADCFDVGSTADSGFVTAGTCVIHDTTVCH